MSTRKYTGGNSWLSAVLGCRPDAVAQICGSDHYPCIKGCAFFYQTECGVLVAAEICGLPYGECGCDDRIFGFHIHSGECCSGNDTDPFENAGMHYNPHCCDHPHHAGDMPNLFGNEGYAFQAFLTDRFNVREIIGRTVIIHAMPDDFTSQPSGNSGEKIACGQIKCVCS